MNYLDKAWTGQVVEDAALQVCIGEIRKALGEDEDRRNPRHIETVLSAATASLLK